MDKMQGDKSTGYIEKPPGAGSKAASRKRISRSAPKKPVFGALKHLFAQMTKKDWDAFEKPWTAEELGFKPQELLGPKRSKRKAAPKRTRD